MSLVAHNHDTRFGRGAHTHFSEACLWSLEASLYRLKPDIEYKPTAYGTYATNITANVTAQWLVG